MRKFALAMSLATIMGFPNGAAAACSWSVVPSPNPGVNLNDLFAVSAMSATDAWAVGFGDIHPLAEHWNGTAWSIVPTPSGTNFINEFSGVSADSPTDAWAVGDMQLREGGHVYAPLIEHWNGTSWTVVTNPNVGQFGGFLQGIVAFSPTNVWADGAMYTSNSGRSVTLVEHWNGTTWKIIQSPNVNTIYNQIYALSATGPHDIWASGTFAPDATHLGIHQTLIEHYNGTSWSIVPSPNQNAFSNNTNAIAAIKPAVALATGDYYNGTTFRTLAEGWNGTNWALQTSPNHGTNENDIFGMAARSVTSAMAVGQFFQGTYGQTYAMKWNGTTWSATTPLNVGPYDSFFNGASAIPGKLDYWAVGGTDDINFVRYQTLIETYHC
jgi:hypothetical protein